MDIKTRPMYMLSTRNSLRSKETYGLIVRGKKNVFHANGKQEKRGISILISEKNRPEKKDYKG